MKNFSASEILFQTLASPVGLGAAGSTNPVDLSNYQFGNFFVLSNSDSGVLNVMRSATSNGTFAAIGASLATKASGIAVRGVALNSSAVWYKLSYDNNNAGSIIYAAGVLGMGARRTPLPTQPTTTQTYSSVL